MIAEMLVSADHIRAVVASAPRAARYAEAYVATGQEFAAVKDHCPLEGGRFCRERCPLACTTHFKETA